MNINLDYITDILHLSRVGVVSAIIAAGVLFWLMFKDVEDFTDCIKYWLNLDYWHNKHELFSDEWYGKTKLFLWLACSYAAGVFAEHLFH